MKAAATLLDRLREETAAAHRRIEVSVDLRKRVSSLDCYRDLLFRFHGFYAGWEPRVIAALGTSAYGKERRKLDLLQLDLRALGLPDDAIERLPVCPRLPALGTRSQALGSMYVLEGSTLGGRIISKVVQQRLGLSRANGCRYFHGYGAQTDSMWRAFGALLLAETSKDDEVAVIAAAQETFDCLREWLTAMSGAGRPAHPAPIRSDRNGPRSSPWSTP